MALYGDPALDAGFGPCSNPRTAQHSIDAVRMAMVPIVDECLYRLRPAGWSIRDVAILNDDAGWRWDGLAGRNRGVAVKGGGICQGGLRAVEPPTTHPGTRKRFPAPGTGSTSGPSTGSSATRVASARPEKGESSGRGRQRVGDILVAVSEIPLRQWFRGIETPIARLWARTASAIRSATGEASGLSELSGGERAAWLAGAYFAISSLPST